VRITLGAGLGCQPFSCFSVPLSLSGGLHWLQGFSKRSVHDERLWLQHLTLGVAFQSRRLLRLPCSFGPWCQSIHTVTTSFSGLRSAAYRSIWHFARVRSKRAVGFGYSPLRQSSTTLSSEFISHARSGPFSTSPLSFSLHAPFLLSNRRKK